WRLKEEAWRAFLQHPIAGVGLDRFHDVSQAAFEHGRLTTDYRAIDPHSTLLGRLAETGIIGGAALVLLWIGFAFTSARAVRGTTESWIATAAAAALIGLFVVSPNVDVMNFRFLWVAAGLITGIDRDQRSIGA
ncbi:MAG: O-antigen ligase family protein, partial [Vicinamibacterales bacterium]